MEQEPCDGSHALPVLFALFCAFARVDEQVGHSLAFNLKLEIESFLGSFVVINAQPVKTPQSRGELRIRGTVDLIL
jgi:hypothetical protein